MTLDEAIETVEWLADIFPHLAPATALCVEIRDSILDLDLERTKKAIRVQKQTRDFFDLPLLLKACRIPVRVTPEQILATQDQMKAEARDRLLEAQRLYEQAKASMAIVDELTDDQAAELKREVLAELPEPMAAAVLHSDPRVSPMLRGLIAAKLVPGKPTLESLPFVPPRQTPQKVSA